MKKVFVLILALTLLAAAPLPRAASAEGRKINVVVTIFPIYDWVRQIAGENLENLNLTMLLDSGADLHNFQPTAADILKVSAADLFIFVGGESDQWAGDVLAASVTNANRRTIDLVEALGDLAKAEELVEGMEHEHDHDGEDHEDRDHEHEDAEMDEHVWLSLRNAQALCRVIAAELCEIDPENAALYRNNLAAYEEKLAALDQKYAEAVETAAFDTFLFGDRFPFRYLADDYDLTYYAAFSGCSAESEASFQTIMFLAGKVDELGLPAVLTIENPKARIAETIVQTTKAKNQKILSMDSMQSITSREVSQGVSYLAVMESNLEVLKQALN